MEGKDLESGADRMRGPDRVRQMRGGSEDVDEDSKGRPPVQIWAGLEQPAVPEPSLCFSMR